MPATTPIIATTAKEGKSVIACFAGDGYPMEYLRRHAGDFYLQPANPSFPTQELTIAAVVSLYPSIQCLIMASSPLTLASVLCASLHGDADAGMTSRERVQPRYSPE